MILSSRVVLPRHVKREQLEPAPSAVEKKAPRTRTPRGQSRSEVVKQELHEELVREVRAEDPEFDAICASGRASARCKMAAKQPALVVARSSPDTATCEAGGLQQVLLCL